jgi:NTE family protein
MTSPAQTGIVLSGGGAYGAFSVGVMKALFAGRSPATGYRPLDANIFTGTSIGALNASIMVSYPEESGLQSLERLERIWVERIAYKRGSCGNNVFRIRGNPVDYTNPTCYFEPVTALRQFAGDSVRIGSYLLSRTVNFLADSAPVADRIVQFIDADAFIDPSSYEKLLHSLINPDLIYRSSKRLRIIATNWGTGIAAIFGNSDFVGEAGVRAVMASTAFPGVFPPVQIGKDIYVDGGVVENTPLKPAIGLGACELHVIFLDPDPQFVPLKSPPNTLDTVLRVFYTMLATKIKEDVQTARWINDGLKALRNFRATGQVSTKEATDIEKVAGQIATRADDPYRILTLHRYAPKSSLGGELGFLSFGLEQIVHMIEEGERVALTHNCEESQCLT